MYNNQEIDKQGIDLHIFNDGLYRCVRVYHIKGNIAFSTSWELILSLDAEHEK